MSDDTFSAVERFTHHGKFELVDGTVIANDWDDLIDGGIIAPINIDEKGVSYSSGSVRTGTYDSGEKTDENCLNWTTDVYDYDTKQYRSSGGYAQFYTDSWSYAFSASCNSLMYLYCFQQ